MKINFTLVQQVIAGFAIILSLQLLVTTLSLGGQQRLAHRVELSSQAIMPLVQEMAVLTREAQQAAQTVTQHAAESDLNRLPPLQLEFESATQAYDESMSRIQTLLRILGKGQETVERVDTSIGEAFALARRHLQVHKQQLRATENEYAALHNFEDTWQYFSPDMKDLRFSMTEKELPAQWLLASLEQDANQAAALLSRVPVMRDPRSLLEVRDQLTYFLGNIETKYKIMHERFPMLGNRLEKHVDLLTRHIMKPDGVLRLQQQQLELSAQNRIMLQELVARLDTGLSDLASFNMELKEQLDRATLETSQALSSSKITIIVTFTLALLVGVAVAYRVVRGVRVPLRELVKRLERLADKDLSDGGVHFSQGEFGTISRSLDTLVGNLRNIIGQLKQQSDDLSHLSATTSRISSESRHHIDNQKSQTETVASAATEMEYTAKDVANNAQEANHVVAQIDSSVQEGRKIVRLNRELVESLNSELNLGVEVITELRDQSQAIGSIVSVIQNIAEQTNLLALNAAIEAARAGEQGRGFAVVADEVRALASKTQASTSEINEMIASLQDRAMEAANIIVRNKDTANQCVAQSDRTYDSFQGILEELQHIKKVTMGIATVAEEQCRVTSDVAKSVVIISSVSDGVQKHAIELEESSKRLAAVVATQQKLTSTFSI